MVDTGLSVLYNNNAIVSNIQDGESFFAQDANYLGTPFSYTNNDNGTISDNNTALLWEKEHHSTRLSYYDAKSICEGLELGEFDDWRSPTLKELFSLADFRGSQWREGHFYLDGTVFDIDYPDTVDDSDQFATHTVQMMGQTWSNTIYTGDHMNDPNIEAAFSFNFLDGHIKQAPTSQNTLFYRCVRGNGYGENELGNNADGSVTDNAGGLIWQQADDGFARNWQDSLAYCENLDLAEKDDWRLLTLKSYKVLLITVAMIRLLILKYLLKLIQKVGFGLVLRMEMRLIWLVISALENVIQKMGWIPMVLVLKEPPVKLVA